MVHIHQHPPLTVRNVLRVVRVHAAHERSRVVVTGKRLIRFRLALIARERDYCRGLLGFPADIRGYGKIGVVFSGCYSKEE